MLKVVDSQHDQMPRDLFRQVFDDFCLCGNESYIQYTIGENDEDDELTPKLEDWLRSIGIQDGEEIIILMWW